MIFPHKVEYWVCSDMRSFPTEKEAIAHEEYLERERLNPQQTSYTAGKREYGMDDMVII